MIETSGALAVGRRHDAPVVVTLFVSFLLLYLRTLCPTVYLGNSGDFCTAVVTGGVVHPTGNPLFRLLGRAAMALVPVGEPAFRIGCLVALAAAAAVVVLYALCREVGCSRWAAAVGAAMYGASYTFWSQATRVEVYSLHVLLCGVLLLAVLRYRRTGRLGWLATAAVAGSLGLAQHLTIVLLGPSALLLCGQRLWNDPMRGRRLAMLGALLPLGPVLYLLLLVWARAEPLHAWGNTVSLSLLWSYASAEQDRSLIFEPPSGAAVTERLILGARLFADAFPYLTWALPLLGAGLLWGRDRKVAIALLLLALVVTLSNQLYAMSDTAPHYLTAWLVATVLLAVALEAIRGCLTGPRGGVALVGTLSCILIGAVLIRNWSACDLSRSTWVRDFPQHALERTERGGVLLARVVEDTFPIWYAQDVLRARPDKKLPRFYHRMQPRPELASTAQRTTAGPAGSARPASQTETPPADQLGERSDGV